jgi:hypothetical protein
MVKKLALLILFVAFISTPALAGNIPEFDAVGNDSANFFNDFIQQMVAANNIDASGVVINDFSDFVSESFNTSASAEDPSPCFPGYSDHKAGPWFPNYFQWIIVLQMAPETIST